MPRADRSPSFRLTAVLAATVLVLVACSSARAATGRLSSSAVPGSSAAISSAVAATTSATSAAVTSAGTTALSTTRKAIPAPARKITTSIATSKKRVPPAPPGPDPLTGGTLSRNPVIAAKIDNTYFDIPQFGVADADVVFVEQVEGGLTRLIAVFHSTLPTEVGPVRSVRSTDAQLLPVFGKPGLVFSGGAGGPLADLAATSIVDTSGFGDAYFRSDVASGTYNLHADLTKIAAEAKNLGPVGSIGFHFLANSAVVAAGRAAPSIQVVMEAGETDFQYTGGRFVRTSNGAPVSDYQGQPETADNVMVLHVVDTPDGTVDTNGQPSYLTKTIGSGRLSLYRDGRVIAGTWKRARVAAPFTFLDATGQPLPMKPGKTWIMLAPQTAVVTG